MIAEVAIVAAAWALTGLLLLYAARTSPPGRWVPDREEVAR